LKERLHLFRTDPNDADWIKQRPASDPEMVPERPQRPRGTRGGGAVCQRQRQRFAESLIDGLSLYALSGVARRVGSFQPSSARSVFPIAPANH
jgi:hypothetical protein